MRRGLLLVTLFLIMKLQCSQSICEEPGSRRSTSDVGFLVRTDQADIQPFRVLTGTVFWVSFLIITADHRFGQPQAEHSEEV